MINLKSLSLRTADGFQKFEITNRSDLSGKVHTMTMRLRKKDFLDYHYNNDLNIQDVFPYLTADEREFIKTGITADEWNEIFAV